MDNWEIGEKKMDMYEIKAVKVPRVRDPSITMYPPKVMSKTVGTPKISELIEEFNEDVLV